MRLLTIVLLLAASTAHAREDGSGPSQTGGLKQTVQAALQAEKDNLSSLERSLQELEARTHDLDTEIGLKKIQLSTFGSLLLNPQTRIDVLEKAWSSIRATIDQLDGWQAELKEKLGAARKLGGQLNDQQTFAGQQLAALKASENRTPDIKVLIGDIDTLTRNQAKRAEILKRLQAGYLDLIARIEETRQGYVDLTGKFSWEIQEKKRADLFQRTVNPLINLGWKNIGGELKLLGEQLRKTGSLAYWLALGADLLASRGFLPVTSLLLYLFTMMLIMRLRRFGDSSRRSPFAPITPGAGWPPGC